MKIIVLAVNRQVHNLTPPPSTPKAVPVNLKPVAKSNLQGPSKAKPGVPTPSQWLGPSRET
eukprot:7782608-Karenia_brevis.AAC.1